ncbi:hypothetical protein C8Q77DRAFT_236077 [Trametes polyzona]|nr:hypothetical protein C8Q77DRAFT_236077 [Trametes polyzona]
MPTEAPNSLDNALGEANAAITSGAAYKATAADRRLNHLGDRVADLAGGQFAAAAQSDAATAAFSLVKTQVVNFAENSRILMAALDEVAKIHPFIQVAVSLFKAALTLELTRRENDEKVLALNSTMCDMMSILTILKRVASVKEADTHGLSVEDRITQRMGAIVDSIKTCAKVCDSYHKRNLTVKIFTSLKWQAKFTQIAQQFVDHRENLQFDLQMYASIGVASTNETLGTMSQNVETVTAMVFKLMQSPQERELAGFISGRAASGEDVVNNNAFLEEVIEKGRPPTTDKNATATGGLDAPLTVAVLRQEIGKDVDSVLAENRFFEQKFDAMCVQLEEVKVTIRHESDRVIDALQAGPHERIVDRDIYEIWKEMGWKRSVEAKHLVMAIRDHFAEKSHGVFPKDDTSEVPPQAVSRVDTWALQYITAGRIQPLLEAIDDDFSSFVTVTEVNAFTAARPAEWSLPRWIAYWTCGFEMTTQWYYRRIRALLARLHREVHFVHPANRTIVGGFMYSTQVYLAENLLSGLHEGDGWNMIDWNWDNTFARFKDYVVDRERQLEQRLQRLRYVIDEANTLAGLIVKGERPETYVLPLVFFLLRRSLHIIRQGATITLHSEELGVILSSLRTVWQAVRERVRSLRAIFRLQNASGSEPLEHYSFGLYARLFGPPKMGPFWDRAVGMDLFGVTPFRPPPQQQSQEYDLEVDWSSEELPLCYGPQVEEIDVVLTDAPQHETMPEDSRVSNEEGAERSPLIGDWGGHCTFDYGARRSTFGLTRVAISQALDGTFAGNGIDGWGPFKVRGTYSDGKISFVNEYAIPQAGQKAEYHYKVKQQDETGAMKGDWGLPLSIWRARQPPSMAGHPSGRMQPRIDTEDKDDVDPFVVLGSFTLARRPIEYFVACPPVQEFMANRARALWKLAIGAAKYTVSLRSRRLDWPTLNARRQMRERYLSLSAKRSVFGRRLNPEDSAELEQLLKAIPPSDLHVWNAIGNFRWRREIVHP